MKALLLDTETTGVDETAQAIQIAFYELELEGGAYLMIKGDTFNEYYEPSVPISLGAQAIHHIFEDELKGCDPSGSFELEADVGYLIGHNIDFDWKVLGSPPVKRICTLALARGLLPDNDSHTLGAVAYHFYGKDIRHHIKSAHNAVEDIGINHSVLMKLFLMAKAAGHNVDTIEGLWSLSELMRVPTHWRFGKHKGKRIGEADYGYAGWYRRQTDTDPYVIKALDKHFPAR